MLDNTVKRVPDRTALAVKRDGEWVKWTYTEYQVEIGNFGSVDLHRIPGRDREWVKCTYTEYQVQMGSGSSVPTQNTR